MFKSLLRVSLLSLLLLIVVAGCASSSNTSFNESSYAKLDFDPDTVKAGRFDLGRMWTFEHAPLDYFEETYNFRPDEEWLEYVRLASPKLAFWCSSSFVSEDGLVMTNHHCIDFLSARIQKEGEDLAKNGFYAPSLEDERKIARVFVDRLEFIEDVTDEVLKAINSGTNDSEKVEQKQKKITELEKKYKKETGLDCRIQSLYNGGKFSLYGTKRYNDVRAVYFNEREMGLFGGDPDNYTYPRYNTDFAFLRVYDDDGKPLKTKHFFKFSANGPQPDEVIFTVGYPGSTQRLKTTDQLDFFKEINFRNRVYFNKKIVTLLNRLKVEYPENYNNYEGALMGAANTVKRFGGFVENLNDPYLWARKKAFEKDFKKGVLSNPQTEDKYGHIWSSIKSVKDELRKTEYEVEAFTINARSGPQYMIMATNLVNLARQLRLPESARAAAYKGEALKSTIEGIFPAGFDKELQRGTLAAHIDLVLLNLGKDHEIVKKYFANKSGYDAADYLIEKSSITSKDDVQKLIDKGSDAILGSGDPLIDYMITTQGKLHELDAKRKEIIDSELVLEDQLGRALYDVYGTSIPPDATFTLRLVDGKMQPYDYNGTKAPLHTTFYGLYDKHYSHDQEYPYTLPEKWKNPGPEFDLETPFNFITTHDAVGGSSGSPMINKNKEIVGVAFDGNIESLSGSFILDAETNRNVGVASQGMLEIIRDLHHYYRLSNELEAGKIVQ